MNLDQILAHVRDACPHDERVQRLVETMAMGNLSGRGDLAWRVCVDLKVTLPDRGPLGGGDLGLSGASESMPGDQGAGSMTQDSPASSPVRRAA